MNQQNLFSAHNPANNQTEQDRLLDEQLRLKGHDVQAMQELRLYLLSFAGRGLVYPLMPDLDLRQILASGELMTGEVVYKKMARSACHRNVAKLWIARSRTLSAIGTGYALSDDGLWRQHSWGLQADATVVETTVVRQKYFGLVLKDRAAELFAEWNK